MRNREKWQPSKFVYRNGKLIASRNQSEVGAGSRLVGDIVARLYDEHLREYAKGKLLDLGCGKVPFFMAYREHVSEAICVDWANTLHKNEYLDLECDLTEPLPFADGEFDTIILSDVLEHIPQPERLWSEIARLLSRQGTIIMNVPFYYWVHEQPHDYYRYTEFALRRFVGDAGLTLLKLSATGGVPEILTDILSKNVAHVPKIGTSLALFAQWVTSGFIGTRLGRKLSAATSKNFPFGYFLIAQKQ